MRGKSKILSLIVMSVLLALLFGTGCLTAMASEVPIYEPAGPLAPGQAESAVIIDPETPLADKPQDSGGRVIYDPAPPLAPDTVEIDEPRLPLASPTAPMALTNVAFAGIALITPVVLSLSYLHKKDKAKSYGSQAVVMRKGILRLAGLLVGMGAIVVFYLTHRISSGIVLANSWTPLMAGLLVIQGVVTFFALKKGAVSAAEAE